MSACKATIRTPPTFIEGVGVALAATLVTGIVHFGLSSLVPGGSAAAMAVTAVGGGWLGWFLRRTRARTGRMTFLALWLATNAALLVMHAPLVDVVCLQLGSAWLARWFWFHRALVPALADAVLTALALSAGTWAAWQTSSLAAAVWCTLLVLALYPCLPSNRRVEAATTPESDRFDRARRTARSAIERLSAG